MIAKTVLLGMNNPDPNDAFRARIKTGSGYRLLSFMNEYLEPQKIKIDAGDFERMFDRRNMLDEEKWDFKRATKRRDEVLRGLAGCRVIMCGGAVAETLDMDIHSSFEWFMSLGIAWCKIPHPSGVNRIYNEKMPRIRAGEILWTELQRGVLWHAENRLPQESFLYNRWPETKFCYPPT
ncbi:hypothetical protein P10VF_135 [Rhizobium phage vB_RleM_P10VF]|uniref:Uncharacterized protein n=1 Tax=Rhizobium phage vB_RleM_P10VF TaxID=1527770 RepID=A0A076YIT1_9CAUD|nr:hypothetical protein P10VF_135 [Rhizobium phage vB_RleM_P10VF]AIK68348.1 hypothetical protein P10VF_135 [Rhizobium phage vB_RleM_P10VF]